MLLLFTDTDIIQDSNVRDKNNRLESNCSTYLFRVDIYNQPIDMMPRGGGTFVRKPLRCKDLRQQKNLKNTQDTLAIWSIYIIMEE